MKALIRITAVAVAALAFAAAGPARADIETYNAILSGDNEVPPVVTDAGGAATIVVDTETLEATWTLEFANLSSAQTGAHFHNAPAGVNGGVVFGLPLGSPVGGVWSMSAAEYTMLADGNIYVNVHTQDHPGGEIRGQLGLSDVVPDDAASFGAVKALYR